MFSYQIIRFSTQSGQDALYQGLSEAALHSSDSVIVHVLVQGVTKTANGWQAVVNVVGTLKPEPELATTPDRNKATPGNRVKPKGEEEVRDKKRKLRLSEEEHDGLEKMHLQMERDEMKERDNALTHLYLQVIYESLYWKVAPKFDFTSVHFISGDSLWDEVRKHHPDIALHESVHPTPEHPTESHKPQPAPRLRSKGPLPSEELMRK